MKFERLEKNQLINLDNQRPPRRYFHPILSFLQMRNSQVEGHVGIEAEIQTQIRFPSTPSASNIEFLPCFQKALEIPCTGKNAPNSHSVVLPPTNRAENPGQKGLQNRVTVR